MGGCEQAGDVEEELIRVVLIILCSFFSIDAVKTNHVDCHDGKDSIGESADDKEGQEGHRPVVLPLGESHLC